MIQIEWVEITEGEAIIGLDHEMLREKLYNEYQLNDLKGHYASAMEKAVKTLELRAEGKLEDDEFVAFSDTEQEIVSRYEALFRAEMDLIQQPEQQTVNVKKFYIARFPITVQQVGFIKKRSECQITTRNPMRDQLPLFPAELDYQNANRLARCLDARLPTEPEWEKAARGTGGQLYPWGDEFNDQYANVIDDYQRTRIPEPRRAYMRFAKTPVNFFEENNSPFGIRDMIGNIREWTSEMIEGKVIIKGNAARTSLTQTISDYYTNVIKVTNTEPYWYYNLAGRRETGDPRALAMYVGVRPVRDKWELTGWHGVDLPETVDTGSNPPDSTETAEE